MKAINARVHTQVSLHRLGSVLEEPALEGGEAAPTEEEHEEELATPQQAMSTRGHAHYRNNIAPCVIRHSSFIIHTWAIPLIFLVLFGLPRGVECMEDGKWPGTTLAVVATVATAGAALLAVSMAAKASDEAPVATKDADASQEYGVEDILNHRDTSTGQKEYLVR